MPRESVLEGKVKVASHTSENTTTLIMDLSGATEDVVYVLPLKIGIKSKDDVAFYNVEVTGDANERRIYSEGYESLVVGREAQLVLSVEGSEMYTLESFREALEQARSKKL